MQSLAKLLNERDRLTRELAKVNGDLSQIYGALSEQTSRSVEEVRGYEEEAEFEEGDGFVASTIAHAPLHVSYSPEAGAASSSSSRITPPSFSSSSSSSSRYHQTIAASKPVARGGVKAMSDVSPMMQDLLSACRALNTTNTTTKASNGKKMARMATPSVSRSVSSLSSGVEEDEDDDNDAAPFPRRTQKSANKSSTLTRSGTFRIHEDSEEADEDGDEEDDDSSSRAEGPQRKGNRNGKKRGRPVKKVLGKPERDMISFAHGAGGIRSIVERRSDPTKKIIRSLGTKTTPMVIAEITPEDPDNSIKTFINKRLEKILHGEGNDGHGNKWIGLQRRLEDIVSLEEWNATECQTILDLMGKVDAWGLTFLTKQDRWHIPQYRHTPTSAVAALCWCRGLWCPQTKESRITSIENLAGIIEAVYRESRKLR